MNRKRVAGAMAAALAIACGNAPGPATYIGGDSRYVVELEAPRVPSGQDAVLRAVVSPSEGWHIAAEFPVALEVSSAAGVLVPEPVQTRETATVIGEEQIAFDVPFTREAGRRALLDGAIHFGVCRDDLCEPVDQDFEIALDLP